MSDQSDLQPGTDNDWVPEGYEIHTAQVNGAELSAAVGGAGPTLVLVHGWPQTSRAWARVMPALAGQFTVVAVDLRGAGSSELVTEGYAKTNQAEDLRRLLDALGLAKPATVVGHDIGAMVALAWAAKFPEDVAQLVLLDALLPGFGLEQAMDVTRGGMWHFGFFGAPWPIPEMLFDGHELAFFTATFAQLSGPGTFSDEDLAFYARAYRGPERLRGGFEQYRTLLADGAENRRLLARAPLPMPVLAIGSQATGTAAGDALRDVAEHVTSLVAPTGHFIAEEEPDWLVTQLTKLVRED